MKTLKIICTMLSLSTLAISAYAAGEPVCTKEGVCFEIFVKNLLDPDPIDDERWGEVPFLESIGRRLKWACSWEEDKTPVRIDHMKRLLQGAKIRVGGVGGRELEVTSETVDGLKDSAFIQSIDDYYFCTIRVAIGSPQRIFDLTVRKCKDMDLAVRSVKEISRSKSSLSSTDSTPLLKQELLDAANQQIKSLEKARDEFKKLYEDALIRESYFKEAYNGIFKAGDKFGIKGSSEEVVRQIEIALQEANTTAQALKESHMENKAIRQSFEDQMDKQLKKTLCLVEGVKVCQENYEKLKQACKTDQGKIKQEQEVLKQEYETEQKKLRKLKEEYGKLKQEYKAQQERFSLENEVIMQSFEDRLNKQLVEIQHLTQGAETYEEGCERLKQEYAELKQAWEAGQEEVRKLKEEREKLKQAGMMLGNDKLTSEKEVEKTEKFVQVDASPAFYEGITFELMGSPTTVGTAMDLKQLVDKDELKLKVDGKSYELMRHYGGTHDYVVIRSGKRNKLELRMMSFSRNEVFAITVGVKGNTVTIENLRKMMATEAQGERLRDLGF